MIPNRFGPTVILLFLSILTLSLGISAIVETRSEVTSLESLQNQAPRAKAAITKTEVRKIHGRNSFGIYYNEVWLSYNHQDGRRIFIDRERVWTDRLHRNLKPGGTVEIAYSRDDPQKILFVGDTERFEFWESRWTADYSVTAAGIGFLLGALYFLRRNWRPPLPPASRH